MTAYCEYASDMAERKKKRVSGKRKLLNKRTWVCFRYGLIIFHSDCFSFKEIAPLEEVRTVRKYIIGERREYSRPRPLISSTRTTRQLPN